jgi:hypothetical protein
MVGCLEKNPALREDKVYMDKVCMDEKVKEDGRQARALSAAAREQYEKSLQRAPALQAEVEAATSK